MSRSERAQSDSRARAAVRGSAPAAVPERGGTPTGSVVRRGGCGCRRRRALGVACSSGMSVTTSRARASCLRSTAGANQRLRPCVREGSTFRGRCRRRRRPLRKRCRPRGRTGCGRAGLPGQVDLTSPRVADALRGGASERKSLATKGGDRSTVALVTMEMPYRPLPIDQSDVRYLHGPDSVRSRACPPARRSSSSGGAAPSTPGPSRRVLGPCAGTVRPGAAALLDGLPGRLVVPGPRGRGTRRRSSSTTSSTAATSP